ncbi:hypothetical protein ABE42_20510 [Bacillus thuringiensis]|nr:hypothetical protein [Bacillus thuringiensis]
MKVLKINTLICTVLLLIASTVYSSKIAAAKGYQKEVVVFENKEISDEEVLISRASEGVTDNPQIEERLESLVTITNESGTMTPLSNSDLKSTTESLKRIVNANGEVVDSYVTTFFGEVSINPNAGEVSSFADHGGGELDSTLSVYSHSRLYYNITTINGKQHYGLTKVTGYWTLQDATTGIKNTKVRIGQTGLSEAGGNINSGQYKDYSTGTSFTIIPPQTWLPIFQGKGNKIGAYQTCTITKGSQSWNVGFTHNLW